MKELSFCPDKRLSEAWLASAELQYDTLIPLLHQMHGAEGVYHAVIEQKDPLQMLLSPDQRKKLIQQASLDRLEKMNAQMEEHRIQTLSILDEEYPHCLRQIQDPPGILFRQGNPDAMNRKHIVAMVGSRVASYAGLKAARKIACEISQNGVTVISGLAYGIDTESHLGCIQGGSPTIAVLGCGLEQTYPDRNAKLKEEIIQKGGLILSEYAPGVRPLGFHFPYRNRIISGLSSAVILMEAKIQSGSMTTVDRALKQGKEVFAYPGDPVSAFYSGNRALIRDGAHYFTSAQEFLSDMNWLDNPQHVGHNSDCSANRTPLSPAESIVYKSLEKGILSFEQILSVTGMTSAELMNVLTMMQIHRLIDALPGKKYQLRQ